MELIFKGLSQIVNNVIIYYILAVLLKSSTRVLWVTYRVCM